MSDSSRDFTVGQLSFRVDPGTGMLRRLRFAGHEVLRGIYAAVRDEHWGTLESQVGPLAVREHDSRVRITLDGRIAQRGVDLTWRVEVEADASGELRYEWHAHAARAFRTNRTGLCVLHPAEAAGQPCRIEHVDGSTVAGWFPSRIAPHQPFRDIRSVTHGFAPGAEAVVRMDGDVFEMEDQRNWSDASFKTYCRPLHLPRPYEIETGQAAQHRVSISIRGRPAPRFNQVARLTIPDQAGGGRPRVGFSLADPLPAPLRERARALRPSHIRVVTTIDDLPTTLAWAAGEATALGCALDLAIRDATRTPPASLRLPPGSRLLLLDRNGNSGDEACVGAWKSRGFGVVGTGTLNHFTELNRHRPAAGGSHDFVGFGVNAQVHAFDDVSLLETVTQHGALVRHASAIGGGRPVAVSPMTLGPAADSADSRLHSMFGAVWTLASLAELAAAGAESVTYFRLAGDGGILREGEPTPLEQLFGLIARATGIQPLPVDGVGDDPTSRLYALLLREDRARTVLVCNPGESTAELEIPIGGEATAFGGGRTDRVDAGVVQVAPRSVWQLQLSA